MIPTSVTGSSPPAACLGTMGNQINNSPTLTGCAKASNGAAGSMMGQEQNNHSAFLGIASLILEGRALAEDEYAVQASRYELKASLSGNTIECGRESPKPSTSRAAFGENNSVAVGNSFLYFGRKSSQSPEAASTSFLRDYYNNSSSSESASSSVESNHSRWSQKLSQLRQESPNAHHQAMAARQKVAVECPRGSDAEYVALSINTDLYQYGMNEERKSGDFEILKRMSINQMNLYNSPNSMVGGSGSSVGGGSGSGGGGSNEHFMSSLQSLASNTCLRVGSPLLLTATSPPKYFNHRQISTSTARLTTPQQQQQQLDYSIGSPSGSTGSSGGVAHNAWYVNSSNSNSKAGATTQRLSIPSAQISNAKTLNSSSATSHTFVRSNPSAVTATATATTTTSSPSAASRNKTHPQQGPHCDQFLRKMGLAKGDASESEEHHCDMSYVNITCTRWRAYCIKMENILARGEPICIEVYLGPVGHKVLLEQWIITQKEKQSPPTMTLPSLCSAIRSQLYFSQISAWCDLIKKSDKTIHETGRVIYTTPPTTSAAGDLATTTNNVITTTPTATSATSAHLPPALFSLSATSPTSGSGNLSVAGGVAGVGCGKKRTSSPRLNIFYRIKQYDSTACFNSKPNVHNFPNVNISENCCVSVCLKSLPRIAGGIPKLGITTKPITTLQQHIQASDLVTRPPVSSATQMPCSAVISKPLTVTAAAGTVANSAAAAANAITTNANKSTILKIMNCDNNLKELQQQQKPYTASTSCSSSYSRCSYANSKNISKPSPIADANDCDNQDLQDVDFECYSNDNKDNIDLSAGGDSSNFISCGIDMVGADSVGDCDSSNSSFSTNNCGNISHREKQLLKYRKRMLKRDKKQQMRKTNENISANNKTPPSHMHISTGERMNNNNININNKMEQGDDDGDGDGDLNVDDIDDDDDGDDDEHDGNNSDCSERKHSVISLIKGQRQQLPKIHKNSIPYINHVKMISTGTQTITNTCISCGSEKSMICLKCNPLRANHADGDDDDDDHHNVVTTTLSDSSSSTSYNYEEIMDAETSSASSLSSSDIIHTPRNKAELLLQAIQRTPKSNNKKHKHKSKDSNQMAAIKQQQQQLQQNSPTNPTPTATAFKNCNNKLLRNSPHNSNSLNSSDRSASHRNSRSSSTSSNINGVSNSNNNMVGCQVCKRQKTQHNFNQPSSEEQTSDDNNSLANNVSLNSSSSPSSSPASGNVVVVSNQTKSSTDDDKAAADGDDNEKDGGKIPSNNDRIDNVSIVIDDVDHESYVAKSCDNFNENEVMEEEYFDTSTKLTPHIDRCSLNVKDSSYYAQISKTNIAGANGAENMEYPSLTCSSPPLEDQKENSSAAESTNLMLAQFKTPTPSERHQNAMKGQTLQPLQPHKHTPKPNLLHIACNFNKTDDQQISKLNRNNSMNNLAATHNPLLLRRSLPKVNLTPIFCNTNSMMAVPSSPIPIGNGVCNGAANGLAIKSADISVNEASPTFSFESPSSPAPSITVQKSNSAPTLPNSPSLSPRFVKASAIYKRRSRHLSDRSDRSSLGSDEQISDEDIDSGMYSPFATSPIKLRTRLAAVFGRKPLLGNLEECLLQRRLVPKVEVMGFKLLLGASGGFCPTQLTIPAAAYFYELKGETLTTPYLCEIRLPRKGYTVPRYGTVQATLLNPMGTVVRMFVIPYDMRDMPTLHQTFIRQRILADTGVQQTNNENQQNGMNNSFKDVGISGHETSAKNTKHKKMEQHQTENHQQEPSTSQQQQPQQRSPQCNNEYHLGHFISAENMKSLRYSIHLRFQTSRTGRLMLHTDIRLLISRRTDCDTAAAHAKGVLEAPNELITNTMMPTNPKYSARQDQTTSKI